MGIFATNYINTRDCMQAEWKRQQGWDKDYEQENRKHLKMK